MGIVCNLENYLISTKDWNKYLDKLPKYILDNVINKPPECVGFGHHPELGWFVMGSGQGPCLLWVENDKKKDVIETAQKKLEELKKEKE